MLFQHFDSENEPPTERMTDDERRAVIARWQEQRGFAPSDEATLPDVAEGLDISVVDAARLLAEIRAERAEAERKIREEQTRLDHAQQMLSQLEQSLAEVDGQRENARRLRERERERQDALERQHRAIQQQQDEVQQKVQAAQRKLAAKQQQVADEFGLTPQMISERQQRRYERLVAIVLVVALVLWIVLVARGR